MSIPCRVSYDILEHQVRQEELESIGIPWDEGSLDRYEDQDPEDE